ncbi:hypothetical protein [Micromonospora sp. NPDC049662]|uniref:hypothetical protein n=1 Tax=Micromonospora sp. NPDC049662 TaxID=3155397 RepID=UPI00343CF002
MIDTRADVHWVCCDANLALCGAVLTGGDRYADDAATCVLCELAATSDLPCGSPFCDVGRDPAEVAISGRCRVCGCTDDDAFPDGRRWVDDPAQLGDLCSGCLPAVTAAARNGVPHS